MKINKICLIAFLFLCTGIISGCSKTSNVEEYDTSDLFYDLDAYKERLRTDRIPIQEYAANYSADAETLSGTDYKQLHFGDAIFEEFPETDHLDVLSAETDEISVEDTLAITKDWLYEIGKEEEVKLESELAFNNNNHPYLELEEDETLLEIEPGIEWPLFYDYLSQLKYGTGAFIDRTDCYMQITEDGISTMSDGKVSDYLNSKGISSRAGTIVSSEPPGTKVMTGSVKDLGSSVYPLLDGEMSVSEGMQMVENYLSISPWQVRQLSQEGISFKADKVEIYHLEDVYYYKYYVQRLRDNVPVACMAYGQFECYGGYMFAGDSGEAYVADSGNVTAYYGINGEEMIPLISENSLLGAADAAEILSEILASQINVSVDSVGLKYLPIQPLEFNNETVSEKLFLPCWNFSGRNRAKGEQIELFVDALTGDVYYYTFIPEDESYSIES